MRGDILLYLSGGILKDRVVCAYTAGPFCHCEIDLGGGMSVGAHSEDGITQTHELLPERRIVISLQERTTPERIESGLSWVLRHEGEPFSWASVAALVLPARFSTLLFGRNGMYNCASLVARYLKIVGILELSDGRHLPTITSPNDVARGAGLLPAGSGWRQSRIARIAAALLAMLPFSLLGQGAPRRSLSRRVQIECDGDDVARANT